MVELRRGLRAKARRLLPRHLADAMRAARGDDVLMVDWVNRGPVRTNWGDAIAPVLVEQLSGKQVVNRRDCLNPRGRTVYTTIGSMLGTVADEVEVWGSGFVRTGISMKVPPRRIHAVRGPLTRARLLEDGIDCPERFGDPALLYPHLYRPPRTKEYELGVIPHFKETTMAEARRLGEVDGVLVIDIRAGITEVADEINRCERIASGSLHGLVLADGYGLPTTWITMSDRPGGDGFKFRDYLMSVGRPDPAPLPVDLTTSVGAILDRFDDHEIDLDLGAFLAACPFLDPVAFLASRVDGSDLVPT